MASEVSHFVVGGGYGSDTTVIHIPLSSAYYGSPLPKAP